MTETKARKFKNLHTRGRTFIMANAWNAGSAVILQEAGIEALGTTSAGIAYSRALPDAAAELPFEMALDETRQIVEATCLPVSMDAENGYAHCAEDVFKNMQRIATTGVVGASIEDFTGDNNKPLYDLALATERIRAAKESVQQLDDDFTLTARAECYLTGHDNPFKESVKRVNQYREAGADCLFVPGISDINTIKQLVAEVDGPISVVMGLSGKPITLAQLQDAGVSRISIGGSLARATFGLIRNAAKEMLTKGSFEFSQQQIPDAELTTLFSKKSL